MYQFFVEDSQVKEKEIYITGSDVNHIGNVLRMKAGEKIRISDASGRAYFCHIKEIEQMSVTAEIDRVDELGTELGNHIYLYQGLPKADKMELIIQKAVELGVYEIIPVAMKNCVVKLDDKKAASKVARWQAIAESAAKQSKRTIIPKISMPITYKQAMQQMGRQDVKLVPYENERGMEATREILSGIETDASIGILVGPEGGFADAEIAMADESGMQRISLGRRILRTETAGMCLLSMLTLMLDE